MGIPKKGKQVPEDEAEALNKQPKCTKLASVTIYALVRKEADVGEIQADDRGVFLKQNEHTAGMIQDLIFRQFYLSSNLQHINIDKMTGRLAEFAKAF